MKTEIIEKVKNSVVNYRNFKLTTIENTQDYLKPYVKQYFDKTDRHFERLMDICINIPTSVEVMMHEQCIEFAHCDIQYFLDLGPIVKEPSFVESQFVFDLFKRLHNVKN